ncbi:hypothetical protein LSCM1_01801 [Leishmania martiniquensis]|uniref:PSP1 C-terminal domain-containing protein n=1 Tax=Leishmania martiniquensis TaxID=1580590 RepID=A0A836KFB8_9TRYP|nr:hypothetical protein LSCM1_01801 [Leishmania martiniquensis]
MAITAAAASTDAQAIFSTPIGRPKHAANTASVKPVLKLPVAMGAVRPTEILSEMKAVNSYLQHLAEHLHTWVDSSPYPGAYISRSSPTSASARGADVSDAAGFPAATPRSLQRREASERNALYLLQTVIENTRRLAIQCQSEVWTVVSRGTTTGNASAVNSGQTSCGISNSGAPSDVAKHSLDAWVYSREVEEPGVSLIRIMKGSPSRFTLVPPPACGEVRSSGGTHASTEMTSPRLPDGVAEHPKQRPWPAETFCYVAHVEFKRGRLRRFASPVTVKVGTYVIVPGDRGYDCGLVVQCALWNPHKKAFESETVQSLDPGVLLPGRFAYIMEVIRVATDEEVHRLHCEHVSMERLALATCREIADRLHLPMEVLDCEYQFDGTKISFFFDSCEVIDFRRLNKELFRIFNARIWMQNTNTAVRNVAPQNMVPPRRARRIHCGFRGASALH